MPRWQKTTALTLAVTVGFPVHAALAAPTEAEKARAAELFRAGRAHLASGRLAEACHSFEQSQRLDPGGGTLLNLALCYEQAGRTATALRRFQEALALAQRDGRRDRERETRERIAALEPRSPRLRLVLPEQRLPEGAVVELDGQTVELSALEPALLVDPGQHRLVLRAPGHEPWDTTVSLKDATETVVHVPPLTRTTAAAPRGAAPPSAPARALAPTPGSVEQDTPRSIPTLAYVFGGLGVVALGAGSYLGVRALGERDALNEACPRLDRCTAEGQRLHDSAASFADWSTVAFAVGAASAGAALYFYLSPPGTGSRSALRLAPLRHHAGASLSLSRAW